MGIQKGGKNKYWTKTKKLRIGKKVTEENQKKSGNSVMKYSKRNELTAIEKLEYKNMKLGIENEILGK